MKTLIMNKLALGLIALNLIFTGQALAAPVELDSKDYLRVTIPAESAESARLVYGMEGNKVEAFPKDGDVIELNAYIMFDETPILGNFLFDGLVEGGNNTLQITGTDPIGYSMKIRFNSSGQSDDIDSAVPLVLEAAGATVEAVQSGGLDEIQNEPTVPVFFGEQVQSFTQQGVLDIRFVVAQPVDDGGQDQGGDNNENQPEAEASGGCSMTANAAGSALNLLGLLPLAGLALARRRK